MSDGQPLAELHAHMAGWTDPDRLLERIAHRAIDWSAYCNAFEQAYGEVPPIRAIISAHRRGEPEARQRFRDLFHFGPDDGPGFDRFQARFDLLAWSSALGPDDRALGAGAAAELDEDLDAIAADCRRLGIGYAELRVMLGQRRPEALRRAVFEHLLAGCARHREPTLRIAMSCNRGRADADRGLIEALATGPHGEHFTAIDFCHREEGHPPEHDRAFAAWLADFNRRHSERALALLVHVGESYDDKSLESAIRWCAEWADHGAHRLAHCLALGLDPAIHGERFQRRERTTERLDQIAWDLAHAGGLRRRGVPVDEDRLGAERRALEDEDPRHVVTHRYTPERCDAVRARQDYVLDLVRARGCVIECCPSANLRIAGIAPEQHPLPRFLANGMPVVVGADDPRLLDVDLRGELALAAAIVGDAALDRRLTATAWACRSERLSGRTAAG